MDMNSEQSTPSIKSGESKLILQDTRDARIETEKLLSDVEKTTQTFFNLAEELKNKEMNDFDIQVLSSALKKLEPIMEEVRRHLDKNTGETSDVQISSLSAGPSNK